MNNGMLKIAYNEYSNWHHYGPLSRLNTIGKNGNEYFFKEHEALENSILVVFYCLINTTKIVLQLFAPNEGLHILQNYEQLMNKYLAD
jgi:hypothetical protein